MNESSPITITRELADAIENVRWFTSKAKMVRTLADPNDEFVGKFAEPLNRCDVDTLVKALYIGYEVEETTEEELRKENERLREALKRINERTMSMHADKDDLIAKMKVIAKEALECND